LLPGSDVDAVSSNEWENGMHVREMLSSHPQATGGVNDVLVQCIEACFDCAQTCMSCADACLAETDTSGLTRSIRLGLDCADACAATGSVLTRRTAAPSALVVQMLETCADFCRRCADECDRHADHHEHCRICAEACRQCELACHQAAATAGGLAGPQVIRAAAR
jgi:hypothetical protein